LHITTANNLHNAHGGESMAYMRYTIWGNQAKKEGFPNVARLFRAIAAAETIHATNHFNELKELFGDFPCNSMAVFGSGSPSQNLEGGIKGETYEINEMYPTYLEIARFQDEKGAQRSFQYALATEKIHAELFRKAKQEFDASNKDITLGPMRVCPICGWTHEGDIPDKCPICGATRDKIITVD